MARADAPSRPQPIDGGGRRHPRREARPRLRPHVETASGMILPDDYLRAVADAIHEVGGLFVLDCIASGCVWVDMEETRRRRADLRPAKGLVQLSLVPASSMMNESALEQVPRHANRPASPADLGKWNTIMEAYLNGGHAYHATMPTDALRAFHSRDAGDQGDSASTRLAAAQWEQGNAVRKMLAERGIKSVARRRLRRAGRGRLLHRGSRGPGRQEVPRSGLSRSPPACR